MPTSGASIQIIDYLASFDGGESSGFVLPTSCIALLVTMVSGCM